MRERERSINSVESDSLHGRNSINLTIYVSTGRNYEPIHACSLQLNSISSLQICPMPQTGPVISWALIYFFLIYKHLL